MKLIHFFRLIQMSIFQKHMTVVSKYIGGLDFNYNNVFFYCPRIHCNDGFSISLQIHNGTYCSSENGYRILGHTMQTVEFGFPSQDEELLKEYAERPETLTETVGQLPIDVAQQIIDKHGGIDWIKLLVLNLLMILYMAKKIENNKGFHIIELTVDETINKCQFGFASEIICDQCNKAIENKDEIIYFIAVLNMAFCKECYEEFIGTATHYEEDEDYEIEQYNVIAELLGLDLI